MFDRCFKQFEKLHRLYLYKNAKKEDVRFGITKDIARQLKYTGEMETFPIELAKTYYKKTYWQPLNLDGIAKFDVCYFLFETAIICGDDGVTIAAKHLQESLNYIQRHVEKSDLAWSELTGDYEINERTIDALKKLFKYPTKRFVMNGGSSFYTVQGTNMDKRLVESLKHHLTCWVKKNEPKHFSWVRWVDQHCINYK